jgi:hypothetical protein
VIEASDGEEAVRRFIENMEDIRLLLIDVVMPKKDGKKVYEEVLPLKPDVKTLFMSGYTANIIHRKGILDEGINFISKPISPNQLLSKIREVLKS